MKRILFSLLLVGLLCSSVLAAPKPIKALLVTGGCCHDYDSQKNLIKAGLEERALIEVTVVHQGGSTTDTKIPLYQDPNWAKGYDIILHDECFAGVNDPAWTARVLKPHQEGVPGVVIHCAMHCYRDKTDQWFKFCGVTSHRHGAQYAHEVLNVDAEHPIMADFGAAWANPKGELYHIEKVWPTATPLGVAKNQESGKAETCVWVNQYGDTRVFGTTLGHHNETVSADKFLDMLTRGTLWACDKLSPEYLKPEGPKLVQVSMAKGKPTTASSEESGKGNFKQLAVDGDPATRWCAGNGSAPQWLTVDLEKPQSIEGCEIAWESDQTIYRYTVDVSADQQNWKTVIDRSKNEKDRNHKFDFNADDVRYVRVQYLGSNTGGWGSIRELSVFGNQWMTIDPAAAAKQADSELLSKVKVPEEFDVTLFAAPPAVTYPVYVAAAPDGVVYVSVDKNGSLDRKGTRGAIYRLRDIDGDGRADESKLFVSDVDSPRGLVWDRDRLYVMHPPHLSAFIDHDGDGVSDEQKILVKNIAFDFKDRPADHTSNGVTLGIDGWLYLAIGDFGFMEAEGADGTKLQFRYGGVIRIRPDGSGLQVYSRGTRNILEVALDPRLSGFTRDNTNDGGGWDIRLHHFSGIENHGYPRLYMNFGDEIIQPLADYGGGSGCGACYVSEPGFPGAYGDAIYTADWGRSMIYRHLPTANGATFAADQEEFIKLPRVTDLDVDAQGNIYATSWEGATFTYNGEHVGSMIRVTPKGYQAKPVPDFAKATSAELVALIANSASHRIRLAAQRELLARNEDDASVSVLAKLANNKSAPLDNRIAAIFTLKQWLGAESHPILVEAAADESVKAFAIRALTDRWDQEEQIPVDLLLGGLKSSDARTQLESIVALTRLGDAKNGAAVAELLGNSDPVMAHTAVQALVALKAADAALAVIDNAQALPAQRLGAIQVVQSLHDADVVTALIERLNKEQDAARRRDLLIALARLYNHEGKWTGQSWGTRPDTRGPYYQPEPWAESPRIAAALKSQLESLSPTEAEFLLTQLARHRVDLDGSLKLVLARAAADAKFVPAAVTKVAASDSLPEEAVALLQKVVADDKADPAVKSGAIIALLRSQNKDVLASAHAGLDSLKNNAEAKAQYLAAFDAFKDAGRLSGRVHQLQEMSTSGDGTAAVWADAGLVLLSGQKKLSPEVSAVVTKAIESGWSDRPRLRLEAVYLANDRQAEEKIVDLIASNDPKVSAAAQRIANAWQIKTGAPTGPKLKTMKPEEAIAQVLKKSGDLKRGEQLFAKLTCNRCHTVDPNEKPIGPYLPQVAKTYKRDQLAESILLPSKTFAQGFVTNIFLLDDGRVMTAFVTSEAADEIVIRDEQGNEHKLDPDEIEARKKSEVSVMPVGLANEITLDEFASLLDYLQSLSAKAPDAK
ncbi:discoidin domain-containing protein [Blastopirellula sp. JC732]|uniref:Discoidin domain-containing protein n=1 Tax=Blastopirellula sediminis TaxID=2894196 RepID=A0A9X1MP65_9BACT|nr:discoidin domain-containing protein [Blastopirellula sediminis]MCC9606438.1 discoidin domain-containing protein [Blastopirellula sediminis]MCC9630264.1 discoidin domain-containing protein [Blastopirellula sediminis]